MVRDCVAALTETDDGHVHYKAFKSERFPNNYNDAYEHVLRHDDVSKNPYTYSDSLACAYPEPYHRFRDRNTGKVVFAPGEPNGYRLSKGFQSYTSEELNPLSRFRFNQTTQEELFFERWFVDDNEASSHGVLFEAVLACHALASESCYNCKCRKALQNGMVEEAHRGKM